MGKGPTHSVILEPDADCVNFPRHCWERMLGSRCTIDISLGSVSDVSCLKARVSTCSNIGNSIATPCRFQSAATSPSNPLFTRRFCRLTILDHMTLRSPLNIVVGSRGIKREGIEGTALEQRRCKECQHSFQVRPTHTATNHQV